MGNRFLAAEDAAADAMAGLAALEPETWNEVDDLVQSFALLLQDAAWTLNRMTDTAERLRMMAPHVAERMGGYAANVMQAADGIADYQHFSLVRR